MNSYNGFTSAERTKAQRWLNEEYRAGRRVRPTSCVACGQDRGVIEAHAEDYSGPPYERVDEFPLCYRCHMLVHCRFRAPYAFEKYVRSLELGMVWPAMQTRSWPAIQAYLAVPSEPRLDERTGGDPRILRAIASGEYDPRLRELLEDPR